MTEFLHHPRNEFALTFDLLGATVLDPNKEFVVLEQPQPPEAQQAEEPTVPGAEGLTYIVIERAISGVAPGSNPGQMEDWQWATGKGAAAALPKPLDEPTRALWRRSNLRMERGGPEAHKWLLTTFFEKAQTVEDLAYVLKFGFEQTAQVAQRHRQTLGVALQAGVIKSLRFAAEPDAYVIPEAIGHAFNTLGTDDTKWARTALQRQLINTLAGSSVASSQARDEMRATSNALMLQGLRLYEDAGLLDDSFWVESGIKRVGDVADLPEFIAMVHAKLTGPDGEQIVSRIKDQRGVGRSYITSIFEHYGQDPQRHQANAERAMAHTHSESDREERKVDLFLLVKEANRLATGL